MSTLPANQVVIGRVAEGLRYWMYDGREVVAIVLYSNGVAYHRIGRGWLEHHEAYPNSDKMFSKDVVSVALDGVKEARKENLDRTDNYVVPMPKPGCQKNPVCKLYIYLPEPSKDLGERLASHSGDMDRFYESYAEVALPATIQDYVRVGEDQFKHVPVRRERLVLKTGSRSERTQFGDQVEKVVADLEKIGIRMSAMDASKLIKAYDLLPKVTAKDLTAEG